MFGLLVRIMGHKSLEQGITIRFLVKLCNNATDRDIGFLDFVHRPDFS
jgi:hypothetical protein